MQTSRWRYRAELQMRPGRRGGADGRSWSSWSGLHPGTIYLQGLDVVHEVGGESRVLHVERPRQENRAFLGTLVEVRTDG
jgi:hypothetical protein